MKIQPVRNYNYNFSNIRNKSKNNQLQAQKTDSISFSKKYKGYTGWLEIPSCNKDSEGYNDNLTTLYRYQNELQNDNADNATNLWNGDFHIYLDNGEAKIGIVYADRDGKDKDVAKKILPAKGSSVLPVGYLGVIKDHLKDSKIGNTAEQYIQKSEDLQKCIDTKFKKGLDTYSIEEKLNAFGIKTEKNKNGKLTLSEYRQPAEGISFEDIGINEDELLQNVSEIQGNADFRGSSATSLGSVKSIGGDVIMENHNIEDLGELVHVAGSRLCDDSNYYIKFELLYGIW